MNKTSQINLGGIAFNIDDDAYRRLDLYMHELEEHFAQSESRDEIIADIEARLAELLRDHLRGRDIVSLHDVANAIKIMGSPGDFDDEPATGPTYRREDHGEYESKEKSTWDIKTGKRLFRDPDNKVIGGVCSGMAAYFGVEDPLWVRIGFVILFFTFGFGPLAYIIAWILIPEAKTASDRLAMMGHPANVRNIADMIEKGLDDLSDSIKDWDGFKKKSNDKGRHYMQRTDPFGTDVLTVKRPDRVKRFANTVTWKIDQFMDDLDNSLRF
jgi:phage shock protein PspC (stress-responsive transcriptional regulator)